MADETAVGIYVEEGMSSAIPFALGIVSQSLYRDGTHPRHDPHAQDDVDRVGNFEADFGKRRIRRPHDIRDDEHRAAFHRAPQQAVQLRVGLGGRGPVVRRAGFFFCRRADESELLDPRHVVRVRAMQIGARLFLFVQF